MGCTEDSPSVEREIELPLPPSQVWESLPALFGDDAELPAEPGGRLHATGPEGERIGVVEEVVAPRRLTFWWAPTAGDDPPSIVELELDPIAGGTRLRVRETQFDAGVFIDAALRGPRAVARA